MPECARCTEQAEPLAFVEVLTDMPSRETFAQMRAWHGLVERIKAIPVPVVLQVASRGESVPPPDAGTAKKIARDLKRELLEDPQAIMFFSQDYRFLIMGDPRRRGQMVSPLGMRACFVPPSCRARPVNAHRLMEGIEGKVRKYRALAGQYAVPLIVAVGAHRLPGSRWPTWTTF